MNTNLSISDREEALFQEWAKSKGEENFVRDGVINEKAYNDSKLKIAIIVKEHPWGTENHSLSEELHKRPGGMWCKAVRIVHGIRISETDALQQNKSPNADIGNMGFRISMLESICAFNLGKIGGNQGTDMERLALVAMKDKEFIKRQFEIYDSDLTLCAGTFQIVRYVLGHEGIKEEETSNGVPWYKHGKGQHKYMVGINHLADRGQQKPEVAIEAVKEILQNG